MSNQINLFEGMQEQKKGIEQTTQNNEHFVTLMRKRARQIVDIKGEVSIDDLRLHAQCWNIKPKSPHAWGSIFKGEEWRCLRQQPSSWKSNHGRYVRVWTLKENDHGV